MLEVVKLLYRSVTSDFRRTHPYPLPKPAEHWDSVFTRLPELHDGESTDHMTIIHRGEIYPYSAARLRRLAALRPWATADIPGPPKSLKSTILRETDRQLKTMHISHVLYNEPRRIDLPVLNRREDLNIYRLLRAAARIDSHASELTYGGEIERSSNLRFYEQHLLHAVTFADMMEFHTGKPARLSEVMAIVQLFIRHIDIGIVMQARPDVSSSRGSKMSYQQLIAFNEAMLRLPKRAAELTQTSDRPLILMNIYTNDCYNRAMVREKSGYILRSIGTALRGFDRS